MTPSGAFDHRGLRVLALQECLDRLHGAVVARLAFVHDGELSVLPVTFGVDGTTLVFRTSWGSKLHIAGDNGAVALEVDDFDPASGSGWSVLVKGTASIEYDADATKRWDQLGVPAWLAAEVETFWVRVTPDDISGRELMGPPLR